MSNINKILFFFSLGLLFSCINQSPKNEFEIKINSQRLIDIIDSFICKNESNLYSLNVREGYYQTTFILSTSIESQAIVPQYYAIVGKKPILVFYSLDTILTNKLGVIKELNDLGYNISISDEKKLIIYDPISIQISVCNCDLSKIIVKSSFVPFVEDSICKSMYVKKYEK